MKVYKNIFDKIISAENLFSAWDSFKKDKRNKIDVLEFEWHLEERIFKLHRELKNKTYKHGSYIDFYITDPKRRHVHKALVRDRVLHHGIFNYLNPIFEETFISTSFSCRREFGSHKGVEVLSKMLRSASENGTKQVYALKCDIKKFFGTVDHQILLNILKRRIKDIDTLWLLEEVIESFSSEHSNLFENKGVPIGNLTSQLFANIYMNEFDQFVKHQLSVKYYTRYTDDFVIISRDKSYLENLIPKISNFLEGKLALELHPNKVSIRKLHHGIDFLGYVVFLNYKLVRKQTRSRIFVKLRNKVNKYKGGEVDKENLKQSLNSYLGVLSHANTYKLSEKLKNQFWFWLNQ